MANKTPQNTTSPAPPSDFEQEITWLDNATGNIVFQGEPGANSHLACERAFPKMKAVSCPTFEDTLAAIRSGEARYAMIPIENSVAGRVADIHHLLPKADTYIVAEFFLRVHHQLMAKPGTKFEEIKRVLSHTHALGQCRKMLQDSGLTPVPEADTAGSARLVAQSKDRDIAAIAPSLAAKTYGLEIIKSDIEDEQHNTTRFLVLTKDPDDAEPEEAPVITTFIFRVRNVPAALYKALGGFATNNVNMTKLESYQLEGTFNASMFFADIEGHPSERSVHLALEELSFFSNELKVLGTYRASPFRAQMAAAQIPGHAGNIHLR